MGGCHSASRIRLCAPSNAGADAVARVESVTDQPDLFTTAGKIADLRNRFQEAVVDAEAAARDKQHAKGKLTARERLEMLVDPGSFVELDEYVRHRTSAFGMDKSRPYGDSVVTGTGTIHGRTVAVYAQDFSTFGGFARRGRRRQDHQGHGAGAAQRHPDHRHPRLGRSPHPGGRRRPRQVRRDLPPEHRGIRGHPQISIIMGPAAGGAVYSPALTDFVIMVDKTSQMFVTGPDVIKTVTGEDVGMEELGGAHTHNTRSGVAHYLADDEDDAIDYARGLISYLPDNNLAEIPVYDTPFEFETTDADRSLNTVIPDSPNQPYDIHTVIDGIVDAAEFLEVQPLFAPNIVIGFGRIEGRTVGIIANQPSQMAGTLNIDAGEKPAASCASATRSRCRSSPRRRARLPPRHDQEWTGVIRRGAKLLYAYAEATVPLVTVILRKAYGGAYIVMGSKQLGADINLAWPTAEIAVMGGQGAVNILYRGEIKRAEEAGEDVAAVRTRLANEYTYNVASPFLAAERGELDGIIEPAQTRVSIAKALRALRNKRASLPAKKHGNIPL